MHTKSYMTPKAEQRTINMVSGPLQSLLPERLATDPPPFQTPSPAIPSSTTPSPVLLAWIPSGLSDLAHNLARGAPSQTRSSYSTRYLETSTERSGPIPSSMRVHSNTAVLERTPTPLVVGSSTGLSQSHPCHLLHLILVAEVQGAAGRRRSETAAMAGGGSLRAGRAPLSTASRTPRLYAGTRRCVFAFSIVLLRDSDNKNRATNISRISTQTEPSVTR